MNMDDAIDYSPQLEAAMNDILDVLRRHKLGAAISIASSTHSRFLLHTPEWSKIQFEDDGVAIRTTETDEFDCLESSCHMLFSMTNQSQYLGKSLESICRVVEDALREHGFIVNRGQHQDIETDEQQH